MTTGLPTKPEPTQGVSVTDMFQVPSSLEGATESLATLDGLVTASEWQRAAIVFAFTRGDLAGRPRKSDQNLPLSIAEFAAAQIKGLSSRESVRRYRTAWQEAMKQGHASDITPGQIVSLPDLTFPPHNELAASPRRDALDVAADADGVSRKATHQVATHLTALAAAIKADDKVAAAAMKALDDRYENAAKPIPRPATTGEAPISLVYEFRRLHRSVDAIIQLVIDGKAIVSDSEREAVLREVEWLRTALGYIEDGVKGDSLDQVLAEMLANGS